MQTSPYSAPVDFEFYNDDQEPVLFLTDEAAGHQMTLLLSNTSAEGISYGSADDYHFELVFRPQTLKNPEGIQIQSSGYSLIGAPHINEDGTLSIFIKSDDTKPWAEKEEILLSGFRAEAGIGTRGTRVMLRYKNLLHGAGDFSGNKEEQLSIVNHVGRINIPLHVGFVGSNHVLNDGSTPNELTVRVSNPQRLQTTLSANDNSRLVLVFQGGSVEEEWALAKNSQLDGLVVHVVHPNGERVPTVLNAPLITDLDGYDSVRGTNERVIHFRDLESGEFLDIDISNIISGHPAGQTNLVVHYESIPGYRDGQFVLAIEKSPIVIQDTRVAIGTNDPNGNLHISSGVSGDCKLILEADAGKNSEREDDNPHLIFQQDGGQQQSAVYMDSNRLILANSVSNGGITFRTGTSYPYTKATERMRITSDGNIGIGTDSPEAQFHIINEPQDSRGNTLILGPAGADSNLRLGYHTNYSWIQSHGSKPLAINELGSDVGIGTNDPKGNLHISSGASGDCKLIIEADAEKNSEREDDNPHLIFQQDGGQQQSAVYMDSNRLILANSVSNGGITFRTGTSYPYTKATEKMRIASDGDVGIGTTSPERRLHIGNGKEDSLPGIRIEGGVGGLPLGDTGRTVKGRYYWDIVVDANGGNEQDLQFRVNNVTKFIMEPNEKKVWVTSDERLKKDIGPLGSVLEKVCALKPSLYRWKENAPGSKKSMGFIAQDVEALFPGLVKEKEGYKNISYTDFGILAIGAIKEQQEEIENLKTKLTAQQEMMEQMMKRLDVLEGK